MPRQLTLALYGLANVFLFSMSGMYHLLEPGTPARVVLQRLDHAAIFLLIAATFTPAKWILFQAWHRWLPLAVVWIAAILGIIFKTIYFDDFSESLGLTIYLSLGWIGVVSGFFIWYCYGAGLFCLLLAGALGYTLGAVLDFMRWPQLVPGICGPHECFHLAVLFAACCHGLLMYRIASGNIPRVARPNPLGTFPHAFSPLGE